MMLKHSVELTGDEDVVDAVVDEADPQRDEEERKGSAPVFDVAYVSWNTGGEFRLQPPSSFACTACPLLPLIGVQPFK